MPRPLASPPRAKRVALLISVTAALLTQAGYTDADDPECDSALDNNEAEAPCEDGTYCGAEGTCVAHECGDGVLAPDEACDDGNENDADGCTAECAIAPIAVGEACPVPGADCAEGSA